MRVWRSAGARVDDLRVPKIWPPMPMAMRRTPRMRVVQTMVLPFYPKWSGCGKRQSGVAGSKVLGTGSTMGGREAAVEAGVRE